MGTLGGKGLNKEKGVCESISKKYPYIFYAEIKKY